jgi:hypothetical protein
MVGRLMNDLERIWKETVTAQARYYPGICLKELSKTQETSVRQLVYRLRFEPITSRVQAQSLTDT